MVCNKANNGNERKEGIWGAGNQTAAEQAVRAGARTQGPLCPSWRQMPAVLQVSRWSRASLKGSRTQIRQGLAPPGEDREGFRAKPPHEWERAGV